MSQTPLAAEVEVTHRNVIEVYDALRAVIFTCAPTKGNLTAGSDIEYVPEAKRRLDRLEAALRPFSAGGIARDPFVAPAPVEFRFPSAFGVIEPLVAVASGTSVHDTLVKLALRVRNSLCVMESRIEVDPETGKPFEALHWGNGREIETIAKIGGREEVVKACCSGGGPTTRHYTAFEWSPDLWRRLREQSAQGLYALSSNRGFGANAEELRTRLEYEYANWFRENPQPTSTDDPLHLFMAPDGCTRNSSRNSPHGSASSSAN